MHAHAFVSTARRSPHSDFVETPWKQSAEIKVRRQVSGSLEVYYRQERPESDEGPFLREERNLINAIAERLGKILERREAESALERSEARFRELFNNMTDGVAVFVAKKDGEDFVFKDLNHAGEQIDQIKREDVIGRSVLDIFPKAKEFGFFNVLQRVWTTGRPELHPTSLYQDDRITAWRESQVYSLPSGEIVAVYRDVSDQKKAEAALLESEKRLRDLVENSLMGIFIIQKDRIVYANPEFKRLVGTVGKSLRLRDFPNVHPDDLAKVKQLYRDITSGRIQRLDTDFRFYPAGKTGQRAEMKWVYCRASLIDYRGKASVLVNIMNITRARELENLLRVQDKMSSLGRVAAGIAHEIRNPLSGINIYLNTLEKIFDKGNSLEKVNMILNQLKAASNKIESVIRRVMDFSKPSEPHFVETDINRPVEEAINLSMVTLRKRNIGLEKGLAQDLPKCHVDPHMIEQVVLNLITNAAEAMKDDLGEKKIRINSYRDQDRLVIEVSDSGPGVPVHLWDKIFDPFYTTKNDSTGIGLSLSHRIISDHGGTLSAHQAVWAALHF